MSGRHVGRRDAAVSGLAMLILAAAAAGADKAEELDGPLLALCDEFQAAQREMDGMWIDGERVFNGDPRIERECNLVDRCLYIREDLAALTPKTPEGLRAKARVILTDFRGEDNPDFDSYDPRIAMTMSLARDILGRSV